MTAVNHIHAQLEANAAEVISKAWKICRELFQALETAVATPPARSSARAIVLQLRHPGGKLLPAGTMNGSACQNFNTEKATTMVLREAATRCEP
jgi:hypothetical protein